MMMNFNYLCIKNTIMVVEVSTLAYSKIVLHALKYPQYAVRGVLLGHVLNQPAALAKNGDENASSSDIVEVRVIDAIPAIHNSIVAPNIETLLIHLDVYCEEEQLKIVGLYFVNQRMIDNNFDEAWCRIAIDKLRLPIALQVENSKLNINSSCPCLHAFCYEGKWKQQQCKIENCEDTITITSIAVQNKLYRELADFENHLDHPQSFDFFNTDLNLKIETIM